MPNTTCLFCGGPAEAWAPRPDRPYTAFRCEACGRPYSVTDELIEALGSGRVRAPDKEVFRDWLAKEPVLDEVKDRGPVMTENTIRKIQRARH